MTNFTNCVPFKLRPATNCVPVVRCSFLLVTTVTEVSPPFRGVPQIWRWQISLRVFFSTLLRCSCRARRDSILYLTKPKTWVQKPGWYRCAAGARSRSQTRGCCACCATGRVPASWHRSCGPPVLGGERSQRRGWPPDKWTPEPGSLPEFASASAKQHGQFGAPVLPVPD